MPWEKQFDIDAALGKAMEAFWARGYEATSTQDLVDCMGINRGSLYGTFGSKRELFLKALKRYDHQHREGWLGALAKEPSPRAAIIGVFNGVVESVLKRGARNGCLLVNTSLELSPHDPEIADLVADSLKAVEDFFRSRIAAGQAAGEIAEDLPPRETAQGLLSLFIGLRVLSRSRPEARLLRSIAKQAEALIS